MGFDIENNGLFLCFGNGKDFVLNIGLLDDIICIFFSFGDFDFNDEFFECVGLFVFVVELIFFFVLIKICNKFDDVLNVFVFDEFEYRLFEKLNSLVLVFYEIYFLEEKDIELLVNVFFNMLYLLFLFCLEECYLFFSLFLLLDVKCDVFDLRS